LLVVGGYNHIVMLAAMHWAPLLIEAAPRGRADVLVVTYALLHFYVLGYVLMADRLKAVFTDFPKPKEPIPTA
jgi:hypothetical protein